MHDTARAWFVLKTAGCVFSIPYYHNNDASTYIFRCTLFRKMVHGKIMLGNVFVHVSKLSPLRHAKYSDVPPEVDEIQKNAAVLTTAFRCQHMTRYFTQ